MIKLLILVVFVPLLFVRWLRWLAIVQQKSYRWDRLSLFISTVEGRKEIKQFCPLISWLNWTGLKRPVKTVRVGAIAFLSLAFNLLLTGVSLNRSPWILLFCMSILLVFQPGVIILATAPTTIGRWLVSHYYQWRASCLINRHEPRIIGITGSYGKTSTKLVVAAVLKQKFDIFATQRSHNTRLSLPKDITARYQGEELVVIEFAAYGTGEIAHLADLFPPDVAVITGLTDQHLGLFQTRDKIITAKAELVKALNPGGVVLVNGADSGAEQIAQRGNAKRVIDFTQLQGKNQLSEVELTQTGKLQFQWRGQTVCTQLVGRQYLAAVQAAIKLGLMFEMSPDQIITGLEQFEPGSYFVQTKTTSQDAAVIDDGGTANPVGFEAALKLLAEIKSKRGIVEAEASQRKNEKSRADTGRQILFTAGIVDLGSKSDQIHLDLARQAQQVVDEVWYVGTTGKEQFIQVFGKSGRITIASEEIQQKIDQLTSHDLILIEGRIPPHLLEQLVLQ